MRLISLRSKGHEKLLSDLNLYINDLISINEKLRKQLKDFNKDDEIQKLKEQLGIFRTNSIHVMSDKENESAKKFSSQHYNSCKSNIQYILEGNGIGTGITVKCKKCLTEENITDIDNW